MLCIIAIVGCRTERTNTGNTDNRKRDNNTQQTDPASSISQEKKTLDSKTYIDMKVQLLELEYSYKKNETAAWNKFSGDFDGYKEYVEKIYVDYKDQRKKIFKKFQFPEEEYEAFAKLPGNQKKILDYLNSHPEVADRLKEVVGEYDNTKPY